VSAGLEFAAAEEFLYGTLHGDGPLMALIHDVWPGGAAPQGTAFPFVTFQFMSGLDYAAVGAYRIWSNMLWLIKAVGETANFADLNAIVARIDALLHRSSGTAVDGTVWACVREQTVNLPEVVQGKQYRHSGALYRVYAT
jgi:hypothetical protein